MRCEIRHVTEYRYPQPAWDSFNQVRLHPTQEARQAVRSFHLHVVPQAEVTSHKDYFGAFVLDPDGHNIEAVCHAPG